MGDWGHTKDVAQILDSGPVANKVMLQHMTHYRQPVETTEPASPHLSFPICHKMLPNRSARTVPKMNLQSQALFSAAGVLRFHKTESQWAQPRVMTKSQGLWSNSRMQTTDCMALESRVKIKAAQAPRRSHRIGAEPSNPCRARGKPYLVPL